LISSFEIWISDDNRVYCKGAPDVFWMENVENSDVVYPELSGVCTENGVESLK
jgi:hypothetical protein